jgi:hypothetical protein
MWVVGLNMLMGLISHNSDKLWAHCECKIQGIHSVAIIFNLWCGFFFWTPACSCQSQIEDLSEFLWSKWCKKFLNSNTSSSHACITKVVQWGQFLNHVIAAAGITKRVLKLFATIIIIAYWSCLPQVISCEKQASWCSWLIKLVKKPEKKPQEE